MVVIRPLNAILLCFNCACCMVKFVGFNHTAALLAFVVKVCWLFFSSLVATVDLLLSTAIAVFSVVISYSQQSSN